MILNFDQGDAILANIGNGLAVNIEYVLTAQGGPTRKLNGYVPFIPPGGRATVPISRNTLQNRPFDCLIRYDSLSFIRYETKLFIENLILTPPFRFSGASKSPLDLKKRILAFIGTAVGLTAITGCFIWYQSRPKQPEPPKPWNASAIKAEYDHVATEGKENHIAFFYILENTTDFDYRVDREQNVMMTARVEKQNGFTPFLSPKLIDYPIFVPAKKRMRFVLHMEGYTFSTKEKDDATSEERKQYRANLEKYVADQLPNLDGFDLRDGENRFEIVFPAGWKKSKQ